MSKPINNENPYVVKMSRNGIKCPRCALRMTFDIREMMYVNKNYTFKCPCCGKNLKVKMF